MQGRAEGTAARRRTANAVPRAVVRNVRRFMDLIFARMETIAATCSNVPKPSYRGLLYEVDLLSARLLRGRFPFRANSLKLIQQQTLNVCRSERAHEGVVLKAEEVQK